MSAELERAALAAAAGLTLVGLAGMLAGDGPYLSLGELDPWSVVYAIGLFALLMAAPFGLHRRIGGDAGRDDRWERAIVAWGGGALAAGLLFAAIAAIAADGLEAAAVIGLIECGMVVFAVLALILTTG